MWIKKKFLQSSLTLLTRNRDKQYVISAFFPKYAIKNKSPCDIWQFGLTLSNFVPWNQKSFTVRLLCVVWESCWWCDDLSASWPRVWRHSTSSQPHRQPDGPRGEENVVILWLLWFTDPNCSVHAVAHSYVPPRHSELKLRELKVTLMLGFWRPQLCTILLLSHRWLSGGLRATAHSLHCLGRGGGRGWSSKFRRCVCNAQVPWGCNSPTWFTA